MIVGRPAAYYSTTQVSPDINAGKNFRHPGVSSQSWAGDGATKSAQASSKGIGAAGGEAGNRELIARGCAGSDRGMRSHPIVSRRATVVGVDKVAAGRAAADHNQVAVGAG